MAFGDGDSRAVGSGSNVIFVHCTSGERLHIECEPEDGKTCYTQGQGPYGYTTHFSGFLVAQD